MNKPPILIMLKLSMAILLLAPFCLPASAQDNFVGDGFGGRKWYQPGNISVGWGVASGNINGQLYMWSDSLGGSWPWISPAPVKTDQYGVPGPVFPATFIPPYAVAGLTNVKLISMSKDGGLIKSDNTGWVWGSDYLTYNAFPTRVPFQVITNAKHVSASDAHVAFVKNDGTVWSVGYNTYGAFGNGTTSAAISNTAVQMTGVANAVRVAAFGDVGSTPASNVDLYFRGGTLVLKSDGTVWAAGGGGTLVSNISNYSPTQVPGLSNIVDIKCGKYHATALTAAGDVYSWGARYYVPHGIGDFQGTGGYYFTPVKVHFPAGTPPMVMIKTDPTATITFAIDEAGTLWGWGYQDEEQLFGVMALNVFSANTPIVCAHHAADIAMNAFSTGVYLTRNTGYPLDDRVWFIQASAASVPRSYFPLSNEVAWFNSYGGSLKGYIASNTIWMPCRPSVYGMADLGAIGATSTAAGTIDCSKTQLIPAPVAGTASNLSLVVSVNSTAAGTFTPISVSGSGFSLQDTTFILTAKTTGANKYVIPVSYDGSSLSVLNFTAGTAGTCAATLTSTPANNMKNVNMQVWTLDNCSLQLAAPSLK